MATTTAATAPSARAARRTSRALIAGALAGPLFFASAVTQMVLRDGFDITRHPISQLATGEVPMSPDRMSLQIALNGLVAFTWTTVVALVLRRRDIHPG